VSPLKRAAAPLAVIAALVALWELAARWELLADLFEIKPYLVPAPSDVVQSLWENRELLLDNAWVTFGEVGLGFALAVAVGLAFAVALHLSPVLKRAFYPLVVGSQTIPIIVVAPVLVAWLGFGIGPKVAIIALICFFPITVNTLDGLGKVEEEQRKMLRTLGAGRARIFTALELPTALPYLLSGAKIAVAVAVIGAVFGEWAGSSEGLGHLMLLDNSQLEMARVFAAMTVLSAMAIALFGLLALLERKVAWWRPESQDPR